MFQILYGRSRPVPPQPGAAALTLQAVDVAHPRTASLALHGVNLQVPVGARVALVGPNGAGKSTLLKAVAGLLPVQAGEIRVFGHPVGAMPSQVAYLAQRSEIDWRFPITVRRLVVTGRYVHLGWLRRPGPRDWALVDEVLAQLGLSHLAERQISQLSGGQQQRVLLARALAQEADLLLLDEPLNAVDAETRADITAVLTELTRQGKTALIATHDLGRLETDFDGALYLCEGREVVPPPGSFVGLDVGETTWAKEGAWSG